MSAVLAVGRGLVLHFAPFEAGHLALLDLPAAREWAARVAAEPAIGTAYEVPGLAYTLFVGEKAVACAGIRPAFWPDPVSGMGEAWSLFPPRLPQRVWPAVLALARDVLATAEAGGMHRIEAFIRDDNRFGFLLAAKLGFSVEALMQRWGPMDAPTLLMARVKPRPAPPALIVRPASAPLGEAALPAPRLREAG